MAHRTEHDLLGPREIPRDAYWGIHTLRAVENFQISGTMLASDQPLIHALALVKIAAAQANSDLGLLEDERAAAIILAGGDVIEGLLDDQFVVDPVQGGAGTSTNMNINEVLANRALERLGRARGDYAYLHPNEHVNLNQSTNDVYPTAMKLAAHARCADLSSALRELHDTLAGKAEEYHDAVKLGRTQLQDAVPMTLGQELAAHAATASRDMTSLARVMTGLDEISLGATAIGTGISSPAPYADAVRERLSSLLGRPLTTAPDLIQATQDCDAFVAVSACARGIAIHLSKLCNDLRLLASGPRAGFGEIVLPPRQAGSSLMPGKINPVIPEAVNQIAFAAIGRDVTVSLAAEAGQLQLNAFGPIIAHSLHETLQQLASGARMLARHCIAGLVANRERMRDNAMRSTALVTALNPHIGYSRATRIASEAAASGRTIHDVARQDAILPDDVLAQLLQPEAFLAPAPMPRRAGGATR